VRTTLLVVSAALAVSEGMLRMMSPSMARVRSCRTLNIGRRRMTVYRCPNQYAVMETTRWMSMDEDGVNRRGRIGTHSVLAQLVAQQASVAPFVQLAAFTLPCRSHEYVTSWSIKQTSAQRAQ